MELILASASPRRKELLKKATDLPFQVIPSHANEVAGTEPFVALRNARAKAVDIADKYPDSLVIGADTVIEFEKTTIGKPADLKDAQNILLRLSGKKHIVGTGIVILCKNEGLSISFEECTEVYFKNLSSSVIREYLSLVNVLDKAGAYGIQEHGDLIVDHICGSLDNVIGLPVERLSETLKLCRKMLLF